ncbi:hypothetical protein DFS33DRAFT_1107912 [Desarmillaria ectypa]|nr:hypothetical protein DFS33DRAFT_1107912 [Desarmillaria ectypa]
MFAALDPALLLATTTPINIRRCNICNSQISINSRWKRCDSCRSKRTAEHRRWRDGKKARLSLIPVGSTVPLKRKAVELEINGSSERPKAESKQQDCQFSPIWKPVSLSYMYQELHDLPRKQDLCLHASHSIVASPDVDHLQRALIVANGLQECQLIASERRPHITNFPSGCSLLFSCACSGSNMDCRGCTRIMVEDDMSHPLGIKGQKSASLYIGLPWVSSICL